jgi:8-oxo-dGTP pyrophosphatase MutT (NUDIX family)
MKDSIGMEVLKMVLEEPKNQLARDQSRARAVPDGRWPLRDRMREAEEAGVRVRHASVLLALYRRAGDGEWCAALMERPPYDGVHGGQIAIPGGEREMADSDDLATALREFEEEMGVSVSRAQVVGGLSEVYVPPSQFLVRPFIAVLPAEPEWRPDPAEVASILTVPLHELGGTGLTDHGITGRDGRQITVPAFHIERHKVWGATATILAEFGWVWSEYERIRAV